MIIKYHVRLLYDNRFQASFELPSAGGKVYMTAGTHYNGVSLTDMLRRLGQSISVSVSTRRKWDASIPKGAPFCYKWDGVVTDLPELFHNQAATMRQTAMEQLHPDDIVGKPHEPRLLEVCKVNGVWTIKKYEQELLTWEEACNELAKRI